MRSVPGCSPMIVRPRGMRSLSPPAITILLAFALSACGAGERAATGHVVRDSAGIAIIENASPVWTEATRWRVAAEPEVEIGVLEGEEAYQLNQVRGATILADGRLVVSNAGSAELRYYDASGGHLQTVGRRGGGPGEFQYPGNPFRLAGDSVLVGVDAGARRLALFDAAGRFVESYGAAGVRGLGSVVGVLGDGGLVRQAVLPEEGGSREGQNRQAVVVVRHARDGAPLDTVARLPGSELYRIVEQSGSMMMVGYSPAPFARMQQVAVGGGVVYAGAGDAYEVEVYGTERPADQGQTATRPPARLIRLARPNRPVTGAEVAEFRRVSLARATNDDLRRRIERYLANATYPKEMPAYQGLQVDARGNLWVEAYRAPGEEVAPRWEVFDPDGVWLGTVETPAGVQIYEIGEGYLLGRWTDELGVEYVRRYAILK